MGNKDFIKGILERKGKVHFGRVCDTRTCSIVHSHAEAALSCTPSLGPHLCM